MRALPQKAGTPRGARPYPRAHARSPARPFARAGRPEASPPALRVGATPARARVVSGRPEWPGSLGSRPPPPPPGSQPTRSSLSSRNGAGAARGRAPWTRLALGLALSAAAWLAPPCAFPQSVAPKAPLSGGRGRGSCFRFFLSLQSGVASSTPPPLPLSRRGQLRLKAVAVATGDGADRLAPASGR
ncbi:translation initiation factor IF-2-like isoform X4 [Alexandromys fortis]|uniref:translation initiation factor IF-2-like isoform X4 n=1 Tax=Alexandromys fortis TaxID=100897 RepID=UPI002152E684|nr:translation initiation factor IF-2-like isoform X4 [Microtus fortis]